MAQNRSHAVMSQRVEAHDSLDDFPTPCWGTRALCEWLQGTMQPLDLQSCWEPACNRGYMVQALREYFRCVDASDIFDYGFEGAVAGDFLFAAHQDVDWIISNPPFKMAERFILKALSIARHGVAMLVRAPFLESIGRYDNLYLPQRPTDVLVFVERLPIVRGRVDREASSATFYVWMVWRKGIEGRTQIDWLAPCRKRLERDSDYPPIASAAE